MHEERKVLVAGADAESVEDLAQILDDRSVRVVPVRDVDAAVGQMAKWYVGAVVIGDTLPRGQAEAIARATLGAGVPVLSTGSRSDEQALRDAMALGARDYLRQPFGTEDAVGDRVMVAIDQGNVMRDRQRAQSDERSQQLQTKYRELESAYAHQLRSHEESQETYYLDLARMMTIISNIMDGIVFADRNGNVTLMNPTAESLTGVRSFMAIGKPMSGLGDQGELMDAIVDDHAAAETRANTKKDHSRVVEVHHDEQDLLYIKVHTTRVTDYRGQFAGTLTVLQDVTAEHKTDQLKNQYLSIVAHELRTPLTGIKTFSTMLCKGTLGELNEKQHRVMDSIREQSLRLEHQIDKLINLGYLESNDYGQDLELLDVEEFVRSAVAPFSRVVTDRAVELVVQTPDQPAIIQADRADLRRALQALIENAVKFAPDGSEVDIVATADGDDVGFRVGDAGIGIDPRYHRRIFEKFFQVEDPLTRHHGGAGLGLFVARGIIDAHGSQIQVTSELGKGSEFAFRLPKYEKSHETAETAAAIPS